MVLDVGVDGVVVANTTVRRPETLMGSEKTQKGGALVSYTFELGFMLLSHAGGLSGKPLFDESTRVLGLMYKATQGTLLEQFLSNFWQNLDRIDNACRQGSLGGCGWCVLSHGRLQKDQKRGFAGTFTPSSGMVWVCVTSCGLYNRFNYTRVSSTKDLS